ncbi:MAG: hypothetical protein C5B51_28705 [Terriglobia bacterium]|nr:MAG: hypothetical protein C5B51_28705 [Terriglobia bacterium]
MTEDGDGQNLQIQEIFMKRKFSRIAGEKIVSRRLHRGRIAFLSRPLLLCRCVALASRYPIISTEALRR